MTVNQQIELLLIKVMMLLIKRANNIYSAVVSNELEMQVNNGKYCLLRDVICTFRFVKTEFSKGSLSDDEVLEFINREAIHLNYWLS